ncbi:MAG: sulfur carrier protein ThiS [Pseudonocardiaceae bacterium]
MTVTVNGTPWELPDDTVVADVLQRLGAPSVGVAVALDGAVLPRGSWPTAVLRDGATVEVLTAVQGG